MTLVAVAVSKWDEIHVVMVKYSVTPGTQGRQRTQMLEMGQFIEEIRQPEMKLKNQRHVQGHSAGGFVIWGVSPIGTQEMSSRSTVQNRRESRTGSGRLVRAGKASNEEQ